MSGYNPASTASNALPQSTVIFYDKNFVQNLKLWTLFLRCAERRPLPMNSGNKLELFMYQPLAANTAQISEGTVGSGITPTVLTNTTTIGQYGDYISLSDYALQTGTAFIRHLLAFSCLTHLAPGFLTKHLLLTGCF